MCYEEESKKMSELGKILEEHAREIEKEGLQELKEDTLKHVAAKYALFKGELPCKICGSKTWKTHIHRGNMLCVTADVVQPFATPLRVLSGEGYPTMEGLDVLTLECNKCRQLLFFNVYEDREDDEIE